jgi:CxxC motif-containing protein (DUF1111 family)
MFALGGTGRKLCVAAIVSCGSLAAWGASSRAEDAPKIDGRELFTREWIPGAARTHGGDGLGPVFNDTSCVACHNQGGVGGAGPKAKNAQIVTAFSSGADPAQQAASTSLFGALITIFGGPRVAPPVPPTPEKDAERIAKQREALTKIHPGFRTARSVVLHRASTEFTYAAFRGKLNGMSNFEGMVANLGMGGRILPAREPGPELSVEQKSELNRLKAEAQFGGQAFGGGAMIENFTFLVSERNTIPLFGSGKIDAIPDKVLSEAAEQRFEDYPEISGRVAKLKNGFIGRFGWKGQKARLSEFVLTACAVELGLNVPGEPQSGLPHRPEYLAPGEDLNQAECNALIAFVGGLPAPVERKPADPKEAEYLEGGRKLFASVGCAACHNEKLGDVEGIYSDLLLHDMGQELSDSGSYAGFAPNATEEEELNGPVPPLAAVTSSEPIDESKLIGATRQEWRTPPLWGVRDSAPYLHDGRAGTIDQAIAMHGGEATRSVREYFKLFANERLQLTLFLKSLEAPR